ncbi:MAG: response regulator [Candidatus Eisenbacteria bacterium]|uniref:Response regulator n=1 Tax=Eiseniibacteriota bacterium TaxID=2212470 RepID=A0A849SG27_UNCEI|nr:response regulator [Candidatus Eisenbacteria bacterium]
MPHILIVEDEATMSWALSEGLADDGFTIDTFRTAEEAWRWLQGSRSDLVISDLRLPGMSGLELARKLRRGRHAQPVIIVTAYGSSETLRDLRSAGVYECLPKPFRMEHLRQAVHRALETALAARSARRTRTARATKASNSTRIVPASNAAGATRRSTTRPAASRATRSVRRAA